MAELLDDFRTLQHYIAAAPCNPLDMDDYYTEGWAALRQCALDGQHILNCAADVSVPCAMGGPEEQDKAELKQCVFLLSSSYSFSCSLSCLFFCLFSCLFSCSFSFSAFLLFSSSPFLLFLFSFSPFLPPLLPCLVPAASLTTFQGQP